MDPIPSAYLYMCVMSRLLVEFRALVLMQRPTDADFTLIFIFFSLEMSNQCTTSAFTWEVCGGAKRLKDQKTLQFAILDIDNSSALK